MIKNAPISDRERTVASMLIAVAIGVGLTNASWAAFFYPHVLTALFFVVVFSLNMQTRQPATLIATPDSFTGILIFWQMAAVPMIVSGIALVAGAEPQMMAILIAITTAGSVFASPAIVEVIGLNRQIATRVMILSTCVMPISLLVFGELNGVLPPDLSFKSYGTQILSFICIPLVISTVFFRFKGALTQSTALQTQRFMHWASTAALMVFCAGMMTEIHQNKVDHFDELIFYMVLAVTLAIAMYALTVAVFYRYGAMKAMTAGMLVANRNVALSFALLSAVFPPEVMTFVAVAQFPIFISPFLMRLFARYRRHRAARAMAAA